MLRFNTFRAKRYLRSKFVEGKYLLASEATDLELEILDVLRKTVQNTLGSAVAVEDAWKVSKLSATQILIQPGEAWVKGLPFSFREGKDQLVSGAILSLGTVPVGVTISDEPNGLGKIIQFNDGATTPTNSYRVSVVATEELITDVDDPFLKNVNLTETTAQKIRLLFKLNIVPVSLQADSPLPYRDETSTAVSPTNFPNVGGFASPNLKNQIVVNPTAAGNGELISLNVITGSEGIDGRDLQLVVRNNPALGGGQPFPQSPLGQSSFANGTLIDSNGNSFYVNAIFNDTVSTQLVIRIDKEPDQPNPEIVNGSSYTLIKREVFVTDDVNGAPQGKLYWDLADLAFNTANGIVHNSSVSDLRSVMSEQQYYQDLVNQKFDLQIVDGGTVSFDAATSLFTWSAPIRLINPYGAVQTIAAGSARVVDGGSLHYLLNLSGGAIQKGTQAINVTAFGATSTLSPLSLSAVAKGNIVVDSAGQVAQITAIDDVNDTITTSPALTANGAGTIYKDSYGPGMAPLSERSFVLGSRSGTNIYIGGQEIQDGESGEIGDGITQQLLDFIGSTGETDDSPNYTNENYVTDGQSLVAAISALDLALFTLSGTVNAISWKAPVANFAALPLVGNVDGDVRLVLDTRVAYHWNNAQTTWYPLTGTGGGIKVIGGGVLTSSTAPIADVVYQTFGNPTAGDFSYTLTAANHRAATRFIVSAGSPDLSSARLSLRKIGTPTGNLRINLYSATGVTVDSLLVQSQTYSIASLTNTFSWIQLDFLTPYLNAPSDDYYLVVELDGGASVSVGNYVEVEGINSIPAPAPAVSSKYNGTTWVDSASSPLYYTVYEQSATLLGGQQLLNANNFAIVPGSESGSTFVAQNTGEITSLAVKIDIGLATTATYTAKLYATSGGLPTGAALATSTNSFNQTAMSPSGTPTDLLFTFAPGTSLSSGTTYAWVIAMTGNNSSFARTAATNLAGYENIDDNSGWQLNLNQNSLYFDLQLLASSDISLSFTSDMYLEKAGLAYTDNTIAVAQSPIAFPNSFDVAYVTPNLLPGGPALTVTVDTLDQVPLTAVIIARREGTDIIVGSSSTRLKLGQSTELYSQESIQSRNTLRSVDFLRSADPVTWTGTQLQFTSDIILESLNSRTGLTKLSTILASNSPLALADGELAYIVIDRLTASSNVTLVVAPTMPTVSSENEEIIVIAKRIDANGAGYLHLPLHKQVLEPGQTVRLGASGSGSGSGNEILETLKNTFIDAPYELLTPSIFASQADDLVDGASTGAYTLVDKTFTFDSIGDTLVSTQLLDAVEFLLEPQSIRQSDLYVFWNMDAIDPNATYEISRNAGNEWQTMDMERVGSTEAFYGSHTFSTEAVNQTLLTEAAVTGTDALNASTIQELAQKIVLANAVEARSIQLLLNKAAATQGNLFVQIRSDNAGSPSTTVLAESNGISTSGLATGDITVTTDMNLVLPAGTYHIVLRTDATYKAGGFNLAWRRGTGSEGRSYNGTVWTATGFDYGFSLLGITYDLRIRITSSIAGAKLDGFGVYYKRSVGEAVTSIKELEIFKVDGSANITTFAINNFVVNPDTLRVYDVNTGKVYRYGVFSVAGNSVVFDSGQFYAPGETLTLIFDQTSGSAYDNSDLNLLLLASNHLGSTDASIDKSIAGRGIFLRRPDGTLREICIDNNDNITIYSV